MAAMSEWDTERAVDLRHQVMRYYRDQVPGIFLYESVGFAALSSRYQDSSTPTVKFVRSD